MDQADPIAVQIRSRTDDLPLPSYASEGSVGVDLRAAIERPEVLAPYERRLIPTGIELAIPQGFEGQVRPRSGLALRHGVTVLNSPGTIDSDYRGEIGVVLVNLGQEPVTIKRGDRIAQLVVARVERIAWGRVSALEASNRGCGGFGSSGTE